jgi:hypothetical protein
MKAVVHSLSEADFLSSGDAEALHHRYEIIVPIFEFRAVRRELEAGPIQCFVLRLCRPRWPAGSLSKATTNALRSLYAKSMSSRETVAPAQLTAANESPRHPKRL